MKIIFQSIPEDERSPLLGPFLSTTRSQFAGTENSIGNFYSPMDSINNSDDEEEREEELAKVGHHGIVFTQKTSSINGFLLQFEELKAKGIENIRLANDLLSTDGWKVEKLLEPNEDRIQSIQRKDIGKIYRLTAKIRLPAKKLLMKLFYEIENMPQWNPTVLQSKILKRIDRYTDITYQVSAPGGGGIVGSRDFVNLRCWKIIQNNEIINEDDERENNDDEVDEVNKRTGHWKDNSISKSQPELQHIDVEYGLKKTSSVIEMNTEVDEFRNKTSLFSLSKSLGAKVFAGDPDIDDSTLIDVRIRSMDSNETNPDDVFVDARETQSVTAASARSIISPDTSTSFVNRIQLNQKLYIMTSVRTKYEQMPRVSKYTR